MDHEEPQEPDNRHDPCADSVIMKCVALLSGGKDSVYSTILCIERYGYHLQCVANLSPQLPIKNDRKCESGNGHEQHEDMNGAIHGAHGPPGSSDELDSHAFQTVGFNATWAACAGPMNGCTIVSEGACGDRDKGRKFVPVYPFPDSDTVAFLREPVSCHTAEPVAAMRRDTHGVPLFIRQLKRDASLCSSARAYWPVDGDEVEELYSLLRDVQRTFPDIRGVVSGAIASHYQRVRVEHVCNRLGLLSIAPLWGRSQRGLLREMVCRIDFMLIKAAALGLGRRHIGVSLAEPCPCDAESGDLCGVAVPADGECTEVSRGFFFAHDQDVDIKLQERDADEESMAMGILEEHSSNMAVEHVLRLEERVGIYACGEGGEYETLVCKAPPSVFPHGSIEIESSSIVEGDRDDEPCYLSFSSVKWVEARGSVEVRSKKSDVEVHDEVKPAPTMSLDDICSQCSEFLPNIVVASKEMGATSSPGSFVDGAPCGACFLARYEGDGADSHCIFAALWIAISEKLKAWSRACSDGHIIPVHVALYISETPLVSFTRVNAVYKAFFTNFFGVDAPLVLMPARHVTGMCGEGYNMSVHVSGIFGKESGSDVGTVCNIPRCVAVADRHGLRQLHVRSRSEWAPANIGPYAQAHGVARHEVDCAGQIPLVPETMTLNVEEGGNVWAVNVALATRHAYRVLCEACGLSVRVCRVGESQAVDILRHVSKAWVFFECDSEGTYSPSEMIEGFVRGYCSVLQSSMEPEETLICNQRPFESSWERSLITHANEYGSSERDNDWREKHGAVLNRTSRMMVLVGVPSLPIGSPVEVMTSLMSYGCEDAFGDVVWLSCADGLSVFVIHGYEREEKDIRVQIQVASRLEPIECDGSGAASAAGCGSVEHGSVAAMEHVVVEVVLRYISHAMKQERQDESTLSEGTSLSVESDKTFCVSGAADVDDVDARVVPVSLLQVALPHLADGLLSLWTCRKYRRVVGTFTIHR